MSTDLFKQYDVLRSRDILRTFQFSLDIPPLKNEFKHIFGSATSLPAREVTDIELPIGGATVKYPGPPAYNNSWTVTLRDDTDLKLRKRLDEHIGPIAFFKPNNPSFQEQMNNTVYVGKVAEDSAIPIQLIKAYISSLGEISMDYGNDAIATYDVTFNYHRWEFK